MYTWQVDLDETLNQMNIGAAAAAWAAGSFLGCMLNMMSPRGKRRRADM